MLSYDDINQIEKIAETKINRKEQMKERKKERSKLKIKGKIKNDKGEGEVEITCW